MKLRKKQDETNKFKSKLIYSFSLRMVCIVCKRKDVMKVMLGASYTSMTSEWRTLELFLIWLFFLILCDFCKINYKLNQVNNLLSII